MSGKREHPQEQFTKALIELRARLASHGNLEPMLFGWDMMEVTDVNGVKIVQELITLAKSGGGFLRYVMPKFQDMKPDPKLSYVQGIKDWQWYVGTGIYIDDIETAIETKRAEMIREIVNSLIQIVAVLLGLMVFAFFCARRTARSARASFDLLRFLGFQFRETSPMFPLSVVHMPMVKQTSAWGSVVKSGVMISQARA
jgi:hypothetical protein